MAEWAKAKRARNRAAGLCFCGRQPREGLVCCARCNHAKHDTESARKRTAEYRERHKERLALESKEKIRALKTEVLMAYGGLRCSCVGCTITEFEFLSIDHIEGGGAKHRKEVSHVYRWLKKNNFPPGFRNLCMNCNFSYGRYGYCPHQKALEKFPQ